MKQNETPEFLSVDELAAALKRSTDSIYRAIAGGDIPHVRLGQALRIPRAYVEALERQAMAGFETASPATDSEKAR